MENKKHNSAVKRISKLKDQIDNLYEQVNKLEDMLIKEKFKGNKIAVMVDNFKKKNIAYRTTSVRRFELKFNKE